MLLKLISSNIIYLQLFWSVKHVHFDYYKLMYRVTGKTNQSEMLLFTFSPDKNDHIINYTSK
jgi:hypothetical protein